MKEDHKGNAECDVVYITVMSNWKTPGPERVQGFWFKRITKLHVATAKHVDDQGMNGPKYERPDQR